MARTSAGQAASACHRLACAQRMQTANGEKGCWPAECSTPRRGYCGQLRYGGIHGSWLLRAEIHRSCSLASRLVQCCDNDKQPGPPYAHRRKHYLVQVTMKAKSVRMHSGSRVDMAPDSNLQNATHATACPSKHLTMPTQRA